MIDRQAVGLELRYADEDKSAFATADYDVQYRGVESGVSHRPLDGTRQVDIQRLRRLSEVTFSA